MAKIKAWGSPFHGKVEGGVLTLPGGGIMSHPQPNGDCSLIKFAGIPAVNLTSDEKAAFLLDGKEFRDYALKSGGMIYGVAVGADFIYKAPDETNWGLVVTGNGSVTGSNASIPVKFTRFGDFRTKSKAANAPVFTGSIDISGAFLTSQPSSFAVEFVNSHPDGTRAIYKCGISAKTFFVEVVVSDGGLSGVFTITASVVKTPSQVVVVSGSAVNGTVNIRNYSKSAVSGSGYNIACPVDENTPDAGPTHGEVTVSQILDSSPTVSDDITIDRIVSAFYSAAGALDYVVLSTHSVVSDVTNDIGSNWSGVVTYDVTGWEVGSGGSPCPGYNWSVGTTYSESHSNVTTDVGSSGGITRTLDVVLKIGAAAVTTLSSVDNLVGRINHSVWSHSVGSAQGPTITPISGGTVISSNISQGTPSRTNMDEDVNTSSHGYQGEVHAKMKTALDAFNTNGGVPQANALDILNGSVYKVGPLLVSNNMVCLTYGKIAGPDDIKFYEVVHPEGNDGATIYGSRLNTYGSFQPVTEELVRNQAAPVGFV